MVGWLATGLIDPKGPGSFHTTRRGLGPYWGRDRKEVPYPHGRPSVHEGSSVPSDTGVEVPFKRYHWDYHWNYHSGR